MVRSVKNYLFSKIFRKIRTFSKKQLFFVLKFFEQSICKSLMNDQDRSKDFKPFFKFLCMIQVVGPSRSFLNDTIAHEKFHLGFIMVEKIK